MVEGPEVNPLLAAYEAMSSSIDTRIDRRHHDATVGAQTALFENVKVMTTVLQDMGNPFQNESSDLLSLDTKNIVQAFCNLTSHKLQQKQFHLFQIPDSILYDIKKSPKKITGGKVLKSGNYAAPLIPPLLNAKVEVCSYVARYTVSYTAHNAYHFTADRSLHSDTNPTFLESIQPC